jgi:Ca-activated chloride channel homolog
MGGWPGGRNLQREAQQMSDVAAMPRVRGSLTANAPLAPLVWFKSGGSAQPTRRMLPPVTERGIRTIAAEKAGIFKPGVPALSFEQHDEVEKVLAFDPSIDVDHETPEEGASAGDLGEEELPGTSHFSILLDASGSMNVQNETGTRLDEAKEAIEHFVEQLPEGSTMSLRVYGHVGSNKNEDKELSCSTTEVVYAGASDVEALNTELEKVEANGWTPLAKAIEQSEQHIPENATDAIVYIVSDGIETCDGDPVAAAQQLVEKDIQPVINIIGFQVEEEEHQLLMDVAAAGNGTYFDVNSKQELNELWNEEYERMMQAWSDWQQEAMKAVDEQSHELMVEADAIGQSIMEKSDTEFDHAQQVLDRLHAEETIDYATSTALWSRFYERSTEVW